MWELPESFVQKYREKGEKAHVYGKCVGDMTRDELLAVIGYLGDDMMAMRENYRREFEFMAELATARR